MKITAKDILKPALILFVICLVVTALLAGTNLLTKDKIAEQSALEAEQSRKVVLSDADSFEEAAITSAKRITKRLATFSRRRRRATAVR